MKFKDAPQGIKFALGENVKQSNWDISADRRTRYPQSRMGVDQILMVRPTLDGRCSLPPVRDF